MANRTPLKTISNMATLILVIVLTACNGGTTPTPQIVDNPTSTPVSTPSTPISAEVIFSVSLQSPVSADAKIDLELLDEVTGLSFNPDRHPMDTGGNPNNFSATVTIPVGSVIKYRYIREGNPPALETSPAGKSVRYRMARIDGNTQINDLVSSWSDTTYTGSTGRIQGTITNSNDHFPVPNVLVTAGGVQTISASDGSFILDGLIPGTHVLSAYSLDGNLAMFEQQAVVAPDAMTPADISMNPVNFVKVTFSVTAPKSDILGLPIRIIGSSYELGNTFADLSGGISAIASRAPLMSLDQDGKYSYTLQMPVGYDLRYKYTLGDGLWNGELSSNGGFIIRQLIVPNHDIVVEDAITTWNAPNSSPIRFTVKAPQNTPQSDTVSIQFNPFGWTESIPMWPTGNNQWTYILYNPQNLMGQVGYRYCRNDACDIADDQATAGKDATTRVFSAKTTQQEIQDEVTAWQWFTVSSQSTTVVSNNIVARGPDFATGVELSSYYRPSFQGYQNWAFQNIQSLGSSEVVLTPTWSYTMINSPLLEPIPGKDALWPDIIQTASSAQQYGLQVVMFPNINFGQDSADWWKNAEKSNSWWRTWFDRYHAFIMNSADLAAKVNASAIILGEPGMKPALPGGTLADGSSSNVLPEAAQLWKQTIADIRKHYSGQILWAVSYPQDLKNPPEFLSDVDGIYLEWSVQMANNSSTDINELEASFSNKLDADVKPFQEKLNKPLILALRYPSTTGSSKGCIDQNGNCLNFNSVDDFSKINRNLPVNLDEQTALYNAALSAVNSRKYIAGFISEGYFSIAALQDPSSSIHGKPAGDVLWYWFPKMRAAVSQ
jgi:hypothetical protein